MSNETWQTICQIGVALGLGLAALGGLGAYVFSQRIERHKTEHGAYTGKIEPKRKTIFSTKERILPAIELGDSGSVLVWAGPQAQPLISFADDTNLTIVSEENKVKVSVLIRDKSGHAIAELRKNEWKVNPNQSWDRNYSSDALEVKSSSGDIVLQVKALQDRIQLQAKMYDSSGRGLGLGKILGPNGWGGSIEILGLAHPEFQIKIEPMFEYPSDSHLGQLVR